VQIFWVWIFRNFVPSFLGGAGFTTYITKKAFETARLVMAAGM
jgi:hypothetical protein